MTIDTRSPYARQHRQALRNAYRLRRASETLSEAYCASPTDARWNRLQHALSVKEAHATRFDYINAQHAVCIRAELARM
jgi:hypothetical protein